MELRAEVDRQKTVMAELETQRQGIVAERTALSEISQNTQQLQRNAARAEEKLAQLRKQAQVRHHELRHFCSLVSSSSYPSFCCCYQIRGKDSQQATEDLHKQLIEAEAYRLQVRVRYFNYHCLLNLTLTFHSSCNFSCRPVRSVTRAR